MPELGFIGIDERNWHNLCNLSSPLMETVMTKKYLMPAFLLALAVMTAQPVCAQGVTDPGDLAFWQSIQSSTNPAEYRAYLQAYPSGRFAELARLRANGALPAPATTPARAGISAAPPVAGVAAPAAPADDPASDYVIGVSPAAARVGQIISFNCSSLPQGSAFDMIVAVPAGTPEMAPNKSRDDTKIVWSGYVANCPNGPQKGGPFAPGAYEVRWMSTLFNNESRYELKAKSSFTVR
jgi:hypothetical protein